MLSLILLHLLLSLCKRFTLKRSVLLAASSLLSAVPDKMTVMLSLRWIKQQSGPNKLSMAILRFKGDLNSQKVNPKPIGKSPKEILFQNLSFPPKFIVQNISVNLFTYWKQSYDWWILIRYIRLRFCYCCCLVR